LIEGVQMGSLDLEGEWALEAAHILVF